MLSLRQVGGGWLAQGSDDLTQEDIKFNVMPEKAPQEKELRDAEFAWLCVNHVKSNAIVIAKALLHASVACQWKVIVEWVPAVDLEDKTEVEFAGNRYGWVQLQGKFLINGAVLKVVIFLEGPPPRTDILVNRLVVKHAEKLPPSSPADTEEPLGK